MQGILVQRKHNLNECCVCVCVYKKETYDNYLVNGYLEALIKRTFFFFFENQLREQIKRTNV